MLRSDQVEELISLVAALGREDLCQLFATYHAPFPLDFSSDFLQSTPLDRLRHIFLAVCLQSQRMPGLAA